MNNRLKALSLLRVCAAPRIYAEFSSRLHQFSLGATPITDVEVYLKELNQSNISSQLAAGKTVKDDVVAASLVKIDLYAELQAVYVAARKVGKSEAEKFRFMRGELKRLAGAYSGDMAFTC